MANPPDPPLASRRRPLWLRLCLVGLNLLLAGGALWLGMSIPSYFRSVSPLVLEAAGSGTPSLADLAAEELQAGRPGLAKPLLGTYHRTTGSAPPDNLMERLEALHDENPFYRWSGGPAPFYEQFLADAARLHEEETAVIPTLLPAEHRNRLLGFLRQSPNQNVLQILRTRELGGWQRFYPVFSTSGHPLEATILTVALLEQASAIPPGIRKPLLDAIEPASEGEAGAMERLESLFIGILTLGRYTDWLQLQYLVQRMDSPQDLLFTAQAAQQDPAKIPLFHSALHASRQTGDLIAYLTRHGDRGWAALETALSLGQGAAGALLQFDKPVYHPPAFWNALPSEVRESQWHFKEFAEKWPGLAIGARALAFAFCGFFLVAILRTLVLRGLPRPPDRRLLINLDSIVGGSLVMILVWVLIEPGLLDFRPNEDGILQIRLAEILPETPTSINEAATSMIDQVTILTLVLFLILQLLVFIFGLIKISEVRRQQVHPELKLRLLDNEENLFDLGLYVGLGGTVGSLILVVLNVVDASLMAAYASTLFGIIFVAILKVGFLRPYRRKLILHRAS